MVNKTPIFNPESGTWIEIPQFFKSVFSSEKIEIYHLFSNQWFGAIDEFQTFSYGLIRTRLRENFEEARAHQNSSKNDLSLLLAFSFWFKKKKNKKWDTLLIKINLIFKLNTLHYFSKKRWKFKFTLTYFQRKKKKNNDKNK